MKLVASTLAAIVLLTFAAAVDAQAPQPAPAPAAPAPGAPPPPSAAPPDPTNTWTPGQPCVTDKDQDVRAELRSFERPAGPALVSATFFLPAGAFAQIVLREPYQDGMHYYFGYIERVRGQTQSKEKGASAKASEKGAPAIAPGIFLRRGEIAASRIPDGYSLVRRELVAQSDTLLTFRVPDAIGGAWTSATLYIWKCEKAGKWASPKNVSQLTMRVSSANYSTLVVWPVILLIYLLAALASKTADAKSTPWYRYLDPVYMTAGRDGKGSLSKLQLLFFSIIVFGLLLYIVVRTGVLSDLSPSVLLLLGIADIGSAAANGTEAQKNRLNSDNWAWLMRKGWLPPAGWAALNKASWHDIISSDGEFDVYRFQTCVFSLVVGLALLTAGIKELASFTIPDTVLGLLGLSQVVYIGGKLVTKTSVGELNTAVGELRELEKRFFDAAVANADPNPSAGGTALDIAIRRAGAPVYKAYLEKAQNVRLLFENVSGIRVDDAVFERTIANT